MASPFLSVTAHLFNNDAFWTALGCADYSVQRSLRRLNCILRITSAVRLELLETRKTAVGDLLFKQPQSILHRAVAHMFSYNPERPYQTSLSQREAKSQFSIAEVGAMIRRSASDKDSEGHAAARDYYRITMPALLPIILARKGGLRHVSRAVIAREKARGKSLASYIPIASSFVQTEVVPVLATARKLLKGLTRKPKRLSDNYAHLRSVAREIMMCCSGEMASTRRGLASSVSRAKYSVCRVDRDVKNTHARQARKLAAAAEAAEASVAAASGGR